MIDVFGELFFSGLLQGLILALVVLGVMIPFKLLDFPDLTAEGSYPLGGCVYASLLLSGVNPLWAILCAVLAGGLAGVCTALINIKYKLNSLLSGIIVSTMLYSVNLRLMGKANVALPDVSNLFSDMLLDADSNIIFTLLLNLFLVGALFSFLRTEKGLRLRAVGLNPEFAQRQGASLNKNIIFGVFLGNSIIAFAGAVFVQSNNYADIGMSTGIIVQALAAMLIGEKMLGSGMLRKVVLAPFVGALIYQQIQGIALAAGLAPSDIKLMTGVIILSIVALF